MRYTAVVIMVVGRFLSSGMTLEEVSAKTDVWIWERCRAAEYVSAALLTGSRGFLLIKPQVRPLYKLVIIL